MKSVIRMFKGMTPEDWETAKHTNFETMQDEMNDKIRKWVDMKAFNNINDKQYALIDATMVTMYSAMQDGSVLIDKEEQRRLKRVNK